jgi:L-fucose isomerase-like protein
MRDRAIAVLQTIPGLDLVVPSMELTGDGCVSDRESAKKALALFERERIQGLLIGNMTFGMEVAVSTVLNGLPGDIPVLHFCTRSGPIEPGPLGGSRTTDTWCGQFMITSALRRRGIKFIHALTSNPEEKPFQKKVKSFARAIAAISAFKGARIGQLGTRPELFESQLVNEQLLQRQFRQMVVPMDLDTVFAHIDAIRPDDPAVKALKEDMVRGVTLCEDTDEGLTNIARYELALKQIAKELDVQCLAASCWTRLQERFHISACSTFGRLNDQGIITACEVDVLGAATMWAVYNAALRQVPPDFIDWTDLHPTEPNVWLAWHCGNAPMSMKDPHCRAVLDRNERLIQWVPTCFGAKEFRLRPGPVSCARLVEYDGKYTLFIGTGEIVNMEPALRGSYGWVKVRDVADWENKLVENGIIHHGCLVHDAEAADALEIFCHFLDIRAVRAE